MTAPLIVWKPHTRLILLTAVGLLAALASFESAAHDFTFNGTMGGMTPVAGLANETQPDPPACPPPGDPVDVLTGEFYLEPEDHLTPDLRIRGRGPEIDLGRRYRSRFTKDGPLGYGWDFAMNKRLRLAKSGDATIYFGTCREETFPSDGAGGWNTPETLSSVLTTSTEPGQEGHYLLTEPNGTTHRFSPDGLLVEIRDRFGNTIALEWSATPEPIYGRAQFSLSPYAMNRVQELVPDPADVTDFMSVVARDFRLERIKFPDVGGVPNSRAVTMEYGADDGRVQTIRDWTGREWDYEHDPIGNLISVTGPEMREYNPTSQSETLVRPVTRYIYDDSAQPHLLRKIQSPMGGEPSGYFLSQTYDSLGRVTQQILGDGSEWTFDYSIAGKTIVVDGNDVVQEYVFDTQHHRVAQHIVKAKTPKFRPTDPSQWVTSFLYDSLGRLERTTFPDGRCRVLEYAPPGDGVKARGDVRFIRERPAGCPASPQLVTEFTYEPQFRQIATIKDPNGNTTTFQYDGSGKFSGVVYPTTPAGPASATIVLNGAGQLDSVTDPNGNTTKYTYSTNDGCMSSVTRAFQGPSSTDDATTLFAQDSLCRPTQIENGEGHVTAAVFDAYDRIATLRSPLQLDTEFYYDRNGNLAYRARLDPANQRVQLTSFGYDGRNRQSSITNSLGHVVQFAYDGMGNRDQIVNGRGFATNLVYDERGLLFTSDAPLNASESSLTTFNYTMSGKIFEVIDGEGVTTTYEYDGFDRLDEIAHADGTSEVFTLDNIGNLDQKLTRSNQLIDYTFDQRNRLTQRQVYDVSSASPGNLVQDHSYGYDVGGRLVSASNSAVSYVFGYNHRDELISEATTALAGHPGPLPTIVTDYDEAGNVRLKQYSDGEEFFYIYDEMERLNSVRAIANDPGSAYWDQTYDALSLPDLRSFVSGATTDFGFDAAGRIASVEARTGASVTMYYQGYQLDQDGLIGEIWHQAGGSPPSTHRSIYAHDRSGQVLSGEFWTGHLSAGQNDAFDYDLAGNRESATTAGATDAYVPGNVNQYTSVGGVTQGYDLNKNLTSDGLRTMVWDVESQLSQATVGGTVGQYAYDPFARRVRKTVADGVNPAVDTWFVWSGNKLVEEHDGSGDLVRRSVFGVGFAPVVISDVSGTTESIYEVHTDHLDTPRALTDESGTHVWRADYRVYGEALVNEDVDGNAQSVVLNVRFPGQYWDAELGLHYNWHRYYDPNIGRYISADPVGQMGGLNEYRYAGNKPLLIVDPLGLKSYLVSRPLQGPGGRYAAHNFIASNADYPGDPKATLHSFGKSSEEGSQGQVGRVDDDTSGFSEGTAQADQDAWDSLAPGAADCPSGANGTGVGVSPINADDATVDALADSIAAPQPRYAPLPVPGQNQANSNSAAQAVADRAQGSPVPTPDGSRISPGRDAAHRIRFGR